MDGLLREGEYGFLAGLLFLFYFPRDSLTVVVVP